MEGGVKGCFLEVDRGSRAKYKNGIEYPAMKVSLKKAKADIKVTRTIKAIDEEINTKKLSIGDRVTILLELENIGDVVATNVDYNDEYPTSVSVSSPTVIGIQNSFSWNGVISPGAKRDLTYSITIKSFTNYESKPTVTFSSQDEFLETEAEPIIFAVKPPIEIEAKTSPEFPDINSAFRYTVTLKNTAKSAADLNKFEIKIPSDFTITSSESELEKNDNTFSYSKDIPAGQEKSFEFSLRNQKEGNYEIILDYDIGLSRTNFKATESISLFFGDSDIMPLIEIEKVEFDSGESFDLKAKLKNRGPEDIRDISARLYGEKIVSKDITENLYAGKERTVFTKKVTAPSVNKKTIVDIILDGEYMDNTSKKHEFKTKRQITINPQKKAVSAEGKQIKSANPGERAKIEITIKNLMTTQLKDIDILFLPPKPLTADDISLKVTLNPNEEKKVSNYIIIPSDYEDKLAVIKAVISAKYGTSGLYTENINIPIRIGVDLEDNNAAEEGIVKEENDTKKEVDVTKKSSTTKKKGVLNIIIDWFLGLFS